MKPNSINFQRSCLLSLLLLSFSILGCTTKERKSDEVQRPNILLIVADDLGYADLGCYGGDIATPNLDRLATEGIRFSRFHTAPMCAPTRAMLLSGTDNHTAGMGLQGRRSDDFGYEGKLSDRIIPMPEVLRRAGYHTYMTGKWHLGSDSLSKPEAKGFERTFVNLLSSGNHYNDKGLFRSFAKTLYSADGQATEWPEGAYSTDLFTEKMIGFMDEAKSDDKPFFAFLAYTSPHWPLQVDSSYWQKYEGRYDAGYEALKARRLESLKKAGMVPEDAVLPPNHPRVKPWDSLTVEEQRIEVRKMELYAGMVDNLDENIGRIFDHLKQTGQYENTLILFMSDNGAAAEDFYYHPRYGSFLQEQFTDSYEAMGLAESFISYGPQWAEAGSAPFRYFKTETTEGGMIAPMIMAGPGVVGNNEINPVFTTVMDIAPTFYEVAKAEYPEQDQGKPVYPLKGQSIMPLVSKESNEVHTPDYVFVMEHADRKVVRKGEWKLLNITPPFTEETFELYHVPTDLAELNDRKEQEPGKYRELLAEWKKYAAEVQLREPEAEKMD